MKLGANDFTYLLERLGEIMRTKDDVLKSIARVRPIIEEIISEGLIEEKFLKPLPQKPAAYLVHRPPDNSFSIISMVWGPGMAFPIHDHLAWGLIGVLKGFMNETRFKRLDNGMTEGYAELVEGGSKDFGEGKILEEGLVFDEKKRDDIHRLRNITDMLSASLHIIATDLGTKQRNQYDVEGRRVLPFMSGYDMPEGCSHSECDGRSA